MAPTQSSMSHLKSSAGASRHGESTHAIRDCTGVRACARAPLAVAAEGYREKNTRIIKAVFGKYGAQAVRVAECESGLTIGATNGQYLGLFQMGSFARSTYGHSWNPWGQARAAHRYFIASGRDWSPWSCKPW